MDSSHSSRTVAEAEAQLCQEAAQAVSPLCLTLRISNLSARRKVHSDNESQESIRVSSHQLGFDVRAHVADVSHLIP